MTRTWSPIISGIQAKIVAQIQAEQLLQAPQLPANLQGRDLEVLTHLGEGKNRLLPASIRVLPPVNSRLDTEVTDGLEGTLEFPVSCEAKALGLPLLLQALTDLVGLVVDGISTDAALGGLVAGPSTPAYSLGPIVIEGLEATQVVNCRFVVRASLG